MRSPSEAYGWATLLAVLLSFLTACQQSRELAPGQIWAYDNRSGEGASTIEILHIERGTPLGDVYFVSVKALDVHRLGRRHVEGNTAGTR